MADSRVIRIALADHQQLFRDGLKRLLESDLQFQVVGRAADAPQAVHMVQEHDPDVLLLELAMPKGGGLEILKKLAARPERVRTIALTTSVEKEVLVQAMQLGARGVILKESTTDLLFKSIRKVFEDKDWICREDVGQIADAIQKATQPGDPVPHTKKFRLTRREMDIVTAVAAGESNKGIAERLKLSEDTVKHHISNVFDKLGVFSRLELAVFAINHKLVKDIVDIAS
jgi:two-component system nitrate/nitrite response regulator NarL